MFIKAFNYNDILFDQFVFLYYFTIAMHHYVLVKIVSG